MLVRALKGGWRFEMDKDKIDLKGPEPEKNPYSHPGDGFGYLARFFHRQTEREMRYGRQRCRGFRPPSTFGSTYHASITYGWMMGRPRKAKSADTALPPPQTVPSPAEAPVRQINGEQMRLLALKLTALFGQYKSDRKLAEYRWLRNQRQYLGIYDPEIEKELSANRSKAYPKITRVKCISVLSRLMNLMFPGNERTGS
jgi:hypothetical protein